MRRRTFLTTTAATTSLLAGCASLENIDVPSNTGSDIAASADTGNVTRPWESLPVIVTATGRIDRVPTPEQTIQAALDYWEANDEQYLGYKVTFEYQPETDDPDIRLRFVDEITSCGDTDHDDRLTGCAPILDQRATKTITARIESGRDADETLLTLKHELGHVLGLTHKDEPQRVMSNDPSDRIPNYETKQSVVNAYNEGIRTYNDAIQDHKTGGTHWENREYEAAATTFRNAVTLFESAAASFTTAYNRASDLDHPRVIELCVNANKRAQYSAEADRHIADAAEAYMNDNHDQAQSAYSNYEDAYGTAQEYTIADSDEVVAALGLD